MNFAYLDTAMVLGSLFKPSYNIVPVPYKLDEEWIAFEKVLGNFKSKYSEVQTELAIKTLAYREKQNELDLLRQTVDGVSSNDLKDRLTEMIYKYESEEGISVLTQQCGELKGKLEEMKKVLSDTNPERYAKFTCFVCMERSIDLFFDPCGHVICDMCWARTINKETCPGCRTHVHGVRKIYTLS